MQKAFLIVVLFLFMPYSSHPQETTQFHYALNDGNVFQYRVNRVIDGTKTLTVIGDTLMPNGKIYKKIKSEFEFDLGGADPPTYRATRIAHEDSVFLYTAAMTERFLYRLDLEVGLTWSIPNDDVAYREVTAIRDTTLWGNIFQYAVVSSFLTEDSSLIDPRTLVLADTLGILSQGGDFWFEYLTGAIINGKTYGTITSVKSRQSTPDDFTAINYPNPFNHSTQINYALRSAAHVRIQIFNLLGEEVQAFDMGLQQPGTYAKLWQGDNHDGATVASGRYYFLIKTGHEIIHKGAMTFAK